MVLTMIMDFVASKFIAGGAKRARREMKTVVFPEPVGNDTPMREAPESRDEMQASRQRSWYGLRMTGAKVEPFLPVAIRTMLFCQRHLMVNTEGRTKSYTSKMPCGCGVISRDNSKKLKL